MDRSIEISIENGLVRATVKGDVEPDSPHAIEIAMGVAAKAQIYHLLFDIRDARYTDYHAMTMQHARDVATSGISRYRIAVVGHEGDPKLAFFENVANNRGVRLKTFTSTDAAATWLRGA